MTAQPPGTRAVMLVEGMSDRRAVETLASRQGRDLDGEGVSVVAIGGAQAIGASLQTYGPNGLGLRLAGLCDAAEERHYARALERAGLGTDLDRDRLETLGFYVCESDLEDELIRALGAATVERIVATQGELGPFRITFDPERRPEVSNLLRIAALCQRRSPEEIADEIGDRGAAALKGVVADALNERLRPVRARRRELAAQRGYVREILRHGGERARAIAATTLDHVHELMHTSARVSGRRRAPSHRPGRAQASR